MTIIWSDRRARVLFIVALALTCAIHTWLLVARPFAIGPVNRDSDEYWQIATNVASGQGFSYDGLMPTRSRMPGYPLLLAAIQTVAGPEVMPALVVQCLLDVVTLLLLAGLAARLFGPMTGALTALLIALYLPMPVLACRIMSEAPYITVLAGSIVCWVNALERKSLGWFAATGALVGLVGLIRPAGLATLIVLAPVVWLQMGRSRRGLTGGVVALAVGLAIMAPWVARNWLVLGEPALASTDSLTCLWFGTHPYMRTHWAEYATPFFDLDEFREIVGDGYYLQTDVSAQLAEAGRERVLADPVGFLKLGLWKIGMTWTYMPGTRPLSASSPLLFALARVPQVTLLIVAVLGALRSPMRLWSIVLTLAVVVTGGLFLGPATARYIIPLMPLALLLTAAALTVPANPKQVIAGDMSHTSSDDPTQGNSHGGA